MRCLSFFLFMVYFFHGLPLGFAVFQDDRGAALNGSDAPPTQPPWRECVRDIAIYHVAVSRKLFYFLPNPCGFHNMTNEEIERRVLHDQGALIFAGDSTIVRGYIYVVNNIMRIPMPVQRVATLPSVMSQKGSGGSLHFYRSLYLSEAGSVMCSVLRNDALFAAASRVTLYMCWGNYDLNWKIQRNMPMPGLSGPTNDWATAKKYWVKFANQSMSEFNKCILERNAKSPGKLTIVYREQFFPYCPAARFTSPKLRYRKCRRVLLPAIEFYRKVLHPVLRQMNIPIIPSDHMFATNFKHCGMEDGLHLATDCKRQELQMLFNVLTLMRKAKVIHGTTEPLPNTEVLALDNNNNTELATIAPTSLPSEPLASREGTPLPSTTAVNRAPAVSTAVGSEMSQPTAIKSTAPLGSQRSTVSAVWKDNVIVIVGLCVLLAFSGVIFWSANDNSNTISNG